MKRIDITSLLLLLFLASLVFSPNVSADAVAAVVEDMPLLPVNMPEGVTLKAFIHKNTLTEETWIAYQEFVVHADSTTAITLRQPVPEHPNAISAIPNVQVGEYTITQGETGLWTIGLIPGDTHIRLDCAYPLQNAALIDWTARTDLLSAWGTPQSTTVFMDYTTTATDEAFLVVFPHRQAFDGVNFFWSYEQMLPPTHRIAMMSPAIWQTLRTGQEQQDHVAVANVLGQLNEGAILLGLPQESLKSRLVSELLSIIDNDPLNAPAHCKLAQIWLTDAEQSESQQLNYLLLAAEQLEQAKQADGQLTTADETLTEIYYRIAVKLSEEGDPLAAMHYMEHAQNLGGLDLEQPETKALYLDWLTQLAGQGQAAAAIEQSKDLLSDDVYVQLFEYAPPFRSINVETLDQSASRQTVFHFSPYEPVLMHTYAELQTLAGQINQVPGTIVLLSPLPSLVLTVTQTYDTPEALAAANAAIAQELPKPGTLLSLALETGFPTNILAHTQTQELLLSSSTVSEERNTRELAEEWEIASQYASWRESEVKTACIASENATAEMRFLAQVLLDEQIAWQSTPVLSYWSYELASPTHHTSELLGWDEELIIESTTTTTDRAQLWVCVSGGCLFLLILAYWMVRKLEVALR